MSKGYKVTARIDNVSPKLPGYYLLPNDLLTKNTNGTFTKICPGIALGGIALTEDQKEFLEEVEYKSNGLNFSY